MDSRVDAFKAYILTTGHLCWQAQYTAHVCTQTDTCTHVHTRTRARTHTHTHTHTLHAQEAHSREEEQYDEHTFYRLFLLVVVPDLPLVLTEVVRHPHSLYTSNELPRVQRSTTYIIRVGIACLSSSLTYFVTNLYGE